MSELARLEHDGATGVLTLDNPPVGALSVELLDGVRARLRDAADAGLHALVVRSALAKAFGVGADLKLLEGLDDETYRDYLDDVRACGDELARLPAVTIAAIDGLALGGGLELALACTFRVAGPGARLGLPEVGLAMLPGAGGTQRLTALVGRDHALDLLLSGRQVDAAEALRLGLVSRVAEASAQEDATAWSASLAGAPPQALRAILRCVEAASPYAHPPGAQTERREARDLFATDDAREAIRAFVQRRRERAARPAAAVSAPIQPTDGTEGSS